MILSNDLRNGTTIKLDKAIYRVLTFNHNKQARGSAMITTKLRNILTGATVNKTFRAGEKIEDIRIESRPMQYLYNDGESFHFMNEETFDQIEIHESMVEEEKQFLIENMSLHVQFYDENPIGLDLPTTVDLKITYTEPGMKGDTVSGATKPATTETGLIVNVPLFVDQDEVIRVDTRSGDYVERVK